jgi:hypothetical protein
MTEVRVRQPDVLRRSFAARRAGAAGLCALLVACAPQPSVSTSSSGLSPTPTVRPSLAARPGSSATSTPAASLVEGGIDAPDILPPLWPDSLATVVTNDLVVRSLPQISDASTIHPVYLQTGVELFVIDGPAYSDGFTWYLVTPLGPGVGDDVAPEDALPRLGWVASGTPPDPWLLPWQDACPPADLEGIWRERPLVLLACFGGQELTLEGINPRCGYAVPSWISPAWLNHGWCELVPFDPPPDAFDLGPAAFEYYQPFTEPVISETERATRIIGHFDDPAAQTCVEGPPPGGGEPMSPALVVLTCRARFVATDVVALDE